MLVKKGSFIQRFAGFLLLMGLLSSCNQGPSDIPLESVTINPTIERFDLAEFRVSKEIQNPKSDQNELYTRYLKKYRPFLVPFLYLGNDSLATDSLMASDLIDEFLSDSAVGNLLDSANKHFPENYDFHGLLINPLKRFQYYFPEKQIPPIYTFVTGYSPNVRDLDQIVLGKDYWGIGLHYFMGKEFPFYNPNLPMYIRAKFRERTLNVELFKKISEVLVPPIQPWENPKLADLIIQKGIRLYFLDKMLPFTEDSLKINYTSEQIKWAGHWEDRIFKKILPDLFSADHRLHEQYLDEKPFSSDLHKDSSPRLGEFAGWMIVRNYMKNHPEISISELIEERNYQKILKDSKYKPSP